MYWVVPIGGNICPAPDATGVPLVALVVESPILIAAEFPAVALISSQQAGVLTLLAINGWALPSPVISAMLWTKAVPRFLRRRQHGPYCPPPSAFWSRCRLLRGSQIGRAPLGKECRSR